MGNENHDPQTGEFTSGPGGGGAGDDTGYADEDDQNFIDENGSQFHDVMNEAWQDYSIRADTLGEIKNEFKIGTPEALSSLLKNNYQGNYGDEEDFAADYLDGKLEGVDHNIPDIVKGTIDMSTLSENLVEAKGPYASFYNSLDEEYIILKRP